ncbi:MAG: hypothetical protein ACLQVN_07555 [Bryobacteraceae bacterium]
MTYTPISARRVVRVSGLPGAAATSLEQPLAIPPHSDITILHGPVEVAYKKDGQGWTAQIKLPEDLSGNLSWHGHLLPLHPGAQTLKLDQ